MLRPWPDGFLGAQGEAALGPELIAAFEYGLSGVPVLCGLLPRSSWRLAVVCWSSDCSFNSLNCSRKDCSSARNESMRSFALSFFAWFSSDFARSA